MECGYVCDVWGWVALCRNFSVEIFYYYFSTWWRVRSAEMCARLNFVRACFCRTLHPSTLQISTKHHSFGIYVRFLRVLFRMRYCVENWKFQLHSAPLHSAWNTIIIIENLHRKIPAECRVQSAVQGRKIRIHDTNIWFMRASRTTFTLNAKTSTESAFGKSVPHGSNQWTVYFPTVTTIVWHFVFSCGTKIDHDWHWLISVKWNALVITTRLKIHTYWNLSGQTTDYNVMNDAD